MTGAAAQWERLPLHPRPLPHEALSSWIGRLASAYGMVPDAFLRTALGIDPAPDDRELDSGAGPPGLPAVLAERTGVPEKRIRAMTLAGYAPKLTGAPVSSPGLSSADAGRAGWFMPRKNGVETHPEPDGGLGCPGRPTTCWPACPMLPRVPVGRRRPLRASALALGMDGKLPAACGGACARGAITLAGPRPCSSRAAASRPRPARPRPRHS